MEPLSTPPAHAGATHDVRNQAPPLQPFNVYEVDTALREALEREGGGWGDDRFTDTGALAGSREALEHSERCERNEPVLRTHDRYGNRVDEIQLDPSWHWLMREGIDDHRYLHALVQAIAGASDGAEKTAAQSWLRSLRAGIDLDLRVYYDGYDGCYGESQRYRTGWDHGEFQATRAAIIRHLIALAR